MRLRRKPKDDGFVRLLQVKRGAVLAERRDGSVACVHCPFACLAAYEPCEFAPPTERGRPLLADWWTTDVSGRQLQENEQ